MVTKLYIGDCIDVLKSFSDRCARLVFADPPYNCGTKYNVYDDNLPKEKYIAWCKEWFGECMRVADRVIITPGHGNVWSWGLEMGKPYGLGGWYKPNGHGSSTIGWGCWEPWFYYCNDKKFIGGPDCYNAPLKNTKDTLDHPCPKPVDLIVKLIKKTTKEGQLVIDPFCGAGTTGVACVETNRDFIGIDLDPHYMLDIAKSRIESAGGKVDEVIEWNTSILQSTQKKTV